MAEPPLVAREAAATEDVDSGGARVVGSVQRTARRRRRLRTQLPTLLAVVVMVVVGACQPAKKKTPPPPLPTEYCAPATPTNAVQYQSAFDALFAANTAGWAAGDGGYPVPLPGGRILWLFGDTIVGRLDTNGSVATFEGLPNNGFVVQTGNCFRPVTEPIPDPGGGQWIWPTGAIVEGNLLRVFGLHLTRTGPGDFDFALVSVDVATFSLPSLTLQFVTALPVPKQAATPRPSYGLNVTVISHGAQAWVYAYGQTRRSGPPPYRLPIANHYVARAPLGSTLVGAAWQFWHDDPFDPNDGDWLADPNQATPMLFNQDPENDLIDNPAAEPDEAPAAGFPVAQLSGSTYLGSAFRFDLLSRQIDTWGAPTPQGPWTKRQTPAVNVTFSMQGGQFPYGGRVTFNIPGAPIALWSLNHISFDAILANPKLYKVWFAAPHPASIS